MLQGRCPCPWLAEVSDLPRVTQQDTASPPVVATRQEGDLLAQSLSQSSPAKELAGIWAWPRGQARLAGSLGVSQALSSSRDQLLPCDPEWARSSLDAGKTGGRAVATRTPSAQDILGSTEGQNQETLGEGRGGGEWAGSAFSPSKLFPKTCSYVSCQTMVKSFLQAFSEP